MLPLDLCLQPSCNCGSGALAGKTRRAGPALPDVATSRSVKAAAARQMRKNGYFSDVDPKQPLRSPLDRFRDGSDPAKRGGRYKSDFIWNTNWQEQLDFKEAEEARRKEAAAKPAERASGFLSFGRLEQLGDVAQDFSEALRPKARSEPEEIASPVEAVKRPDGPVFDKIKSTHGERRRWVRQDKFNKVAAPPNRAPPAVTESLRADSYSRATSDSTYYNQLKGEVQAWAVALCGMCAAATAYFYSQDISISYIMGAVGGLVYLRMLHKSLDAIGGGGANVLASGLSNQRLLIPIIMVLAFNRWNTLATDRTGIELQLLPMLLGFFTYKAALVGQQGALLFDELSGRRPIANRQV